MSIMADNRIELRGKRTATSAVMVSRTEASERIATIGALLMQYGLVMVVGWIGAMKFTAYEAAGETGHAESVQIVYDPAKISYTQLLDVFWHNIDPLTPTGQFCDHGTQYHTAIFFHDETQRRLAEESKQQLEASTRFARPIVTEMVPATEFYPAEEYHRHYHEKNPVRYRFYRWSCGRDQRLAELWGAAPAHAEAAR
jgi:peptide-methionine (S)-S-oxide reductase